MDYPTLTLHGDHYSQGRQHGYQVQALRPHIARAMEVRLSQLEREGAGTQFERLLQETRYLLQELDTALLDLMRGQAEALEFEYDALVRYALGSYLRDDFLVRQPCVAGGCTTWAASGSALAAAPDGSSGPLLAKNRDYSAEHIPLQVVIQVTPRSGYRYVCSSSAGCPGVFSGGINQAGLAVADARVTSTDIGPGLPDYSLMMRLLEEHNSVASALDYLRSVPRMGRNNLILADEGGHLAVFEIGHRAYGLVETQDGVLVNTNHFSSPELRGCFVDTSEPHLRGNSFRRRELLERKLEAASGRIDVPFAQRLMATHAGPLASICRHPEEGCISSTVSASLLLPARRAMLFCNGLPCQGRYDEFQV